MKGISRLSGDQRGRDWVDMPSTEEKQRQHMNRRHQVALLHRGPEVAGALGAPTPAAAQPSLPARPPCRSMTPCDNARQGSRQPRSRKSGRAVSSSTAAGADSRGAFAGGPAGIRNTLVAELPCASSPFGPSKPLDPPLAPRPARILCCANGPSLNGRLWEHSPCPRRRAYALSPAVLLLVTLGSTHLCAYVCVWALRTTCRI